jgi:hypothetical protein
LVVEALTSSEVSLRFELLDQDAVYRVREAVLCKAFG